MLSCRKVDMSEASSQRLRIGDAGTESGILNEKILVLVFESMQWDIHALCMTASVNRRLHAVAKRLLWRHLCLYRAPKMTSALTESASNSRVLGGWQPLAKLLFLCGGCETTPHFEVGLPSPAHFVKSTRFSKTSGMSFLSKKCRGDVLYVSDPCEHPVQDNNEDIGIYRGVFGDFTKSKTREILIKRQADLEVDFRCPYCGARLWSMNSARLIQRKNAARRLGSSEDALEYFVCLNGHLHGACWLVHLSSDDENAGNNDDSDDDVACC